MSRKLSVSYRLALRPAGALLSLLLQFAAGISHANAQSVSFSDSSPLGPAAGRRSEPSELSVDYTGALFGYYRIEPPRGSSKVPDSQWKLAPPTKFLQQRQAPRLLLGMGDNFGPEFGASVQRELATRPGDLDNPCSSPARHIDRRRDVAPEILYKDERRLPNMAECDNVGRFLMQAGYRAIVPGREDFLYSATWLRRMALLFRAATDSRTSSGRKTSPELSRKDGNEPVFITNDMRINNIDQKLLMLAANLRLNFKAMSFEDSSPGGSQEPFAPSVKNTCPLLFSADPLGSDKDTCISGGNSGDTVTEQADWLRRLDLTLRPDPDCKGNLKDPDCFPVAASMNLQARNDVRFRRQLLENAAKIVKATLSDEIGHGYCGRLAELQNALKDLSDDNAFRSMESASAPLYLSNRGHDALIELSTQNDCRAPDEDLKTVLSDLHRIFTELSAPTEKKDPVKAECGQGSTHQKSTDSCWQNQANFLFSLGARKATIRLLLKKIETQQRDVGYTIATPEGPGVKTLVIGVIGQETMKAVSPVNLRLCTKWTAHLDNAAQTENLAQCEARDGEETHDQWSIDNGLPTVKERLVGTIAVGDPVLAVTTAVRAAWLGNCGNQKAFERVVVMAQMPQTEAEELAWRVLDSLRKSPDCADAEGKETVSHTCDQDNDPPACPRIDLILGEAQKGHTSPNNLEVHYATNSMIPVVTPEPAYDINWHKKDLEDPVSKATITADQDGSGRRRLVNYKPTERQVPEKRSIEAVSTQLGSPTDTASKAESSGLEPVNYKSAEPKASAEAPVEKLQTMAELLKAQLYEAAKKHPSHDLSNLMALWDKCGNGDACKNSVMMQFLLEQIQRKSHADVVLLEFRDFYFGPMLGGYGEYTICEEWVLDHPGEPADLADPDAYCKLRMALDRVLWKGDFAERVMVDGKTLQAMLATAQQETDNEQTLAARDTVQEWLMTFGITGKMPTNLSAASMGTDTFAVPGASFCSPVDVPQTSPYCVNGQRVTDDGAYWVSTSDHLAQDKQIYKVLSGLDPKYHEVKTGVFLTGEIADEVSKQAQKRKSHTTEEPPPAKQDHKKASDAPADAQDAQLGIGKIEEYEQKRPIFQMDYAKLAVGFMFRKPNFSNAELASNFSGVAESRARTPNAQELDVESLTRMTRTLGTSKLWQYVKVGTQSDLEYDRAVTGNLTGSPETVTYALNSLTAGGFFQIRLDGNRPLPRMFLVIAPYQYQQQITGNYLNFKFSTGPGQITVPTPRLEGFSQRLGLREEFAGSWADSYVEAGPEYSVINNVLSGLGLPNGAAPCHVSATATLSSCVAGIPVTSTTTLTPLTETLHTGGVYWNVHLQRALDQAKRASLTAETKGDYFGWPGVTLPTQTRYAFTATGSLNFRVIGNWVLAPTYTTFFYRNQGLPSETHGMLTNTFSVTAKWYFARDSAVPFWRQFWFRGPASLDQTKSAKMQ